MNLYRDYSRKLSKPKKSLTTLFAAGVVILLLIDMGRSIIDQLIESQFHKASIMELNIYIPDGNFTEFRSRFEDDPGIVSIEQRRHISVRIEDPTGLPRKESVYEISGLAAMQSSQLKDREDLCDNEILLPEYLFYGDEADHTDRFFNTDYVRGNQFIGQTVKISYIDGNGIMQKAKLTVRGTYDNAFLQEKGNYYVSEAMIEKMKGATIADGNSGFRTAGEEPIVMVGGTDWTVVLADYREKGSYLKKFRNYIRELESEGKISMDGAAPAVSAKGSIKGDEINFVHVVSQILTVLSISAICWSCLNMGLFQLRNVRNRRQEFGVLKALGYNNRRIAGMLRIETLAFSLRVLCIAGGIGATMAAVYGIGLVTWVNPFYRWFPAVNGWLLFGTVAAVILIPLISCEIVLHPVKKIVPIEIMRNFDMQSALRREAQMILEGGLLLLNAVILYLSGMLLLAEGFIFQEKWKGSQYVSPFDPSGNTVLREDEISLTIANIIVIICVLTLVVLALFAGALYSWWVALQMGILETKRENALLEAIGYGRYHIRKRLFGQRAGLALLAVIPAWGISRLVYYALMQITPMNMVLIYGTGKGWIDVLVWMAVPVILLLFVWLIVAMADKKMKKQSIIQRLYVK